jgi:FkbM family methyltransferase
MQLNYERFYLWFNKLVFSIFYLRHQGKSETEITVDDGVRFNVRVNTSDALMIWEVWKAKVYDDKRIPISSDAVVVDLGGHIGAFAVRAARQARRGMIYSYEASNKNYTLLAKNIELNNLDNLYIENSAITNRRGEMFLYTPANNGILGSLLQITSSFAEKVQARTFADIISEHALERIDFLKVDVEGAEFDILLSCSDEIFAKIQRMIIEYHEFEGDKRSYQDLVNLLDSQGFQVVVEKAKFPQPHWFGTKINKIGIIKAWRA